MTDDEWDQIEGVLEEGFPGHQWTDETGPSYRLMLNHYSVGQVLNAIAVLGKKQQSKFRPSIGELLGELERDPTAMQWPEVEDWLLRPGDGVLRHPWPHEQLIAAAATRSEILASWIAVKDMAGLRTRDFDDEQWGPKNRADLKREWDNWVENAKERVARGIALPMGPRTAAALGKADIVGMLGRAPVAGIGAGHPNETGDSEHGD